MDQEEIIKSLYIPNKKISACLYEYVRYPCVKILIQVMLNYFGIEEILELYNQYHASFENRASLNTLSIRFGLPIVNNFKELLKLYDIKYATIRSYHYKNRTPKKILLQAAEEGNIQALYNGLKMFYKLRTVHIYNLALTKAVMAGHNSIVNLLLDLGANNYECIYISASKIGNLNLVKTYLKYDNQFKLGESYQLAIKNASQFGHIDVLEYLYNLKNKQKTINYGMYGAGLGGDNKTIEYLISKGADDYNSLLRGAADANNVDIIKKYLPKADKNTYSYFWILDSSVKNEHIEVIKLLISEGNFNKDILIDVLKDAYFKKSSTIIDYLENKGIYV